MRIVLTRSDASMSSCTRAHDCAATFTATHTSSLSFPLQLYRGVDPIRRRTSEYVDVAEKTAAATATRRGKVAAEIGRRRPCMHACTWCGGRVQDDGPRLASSRWSSTASTAGRSERAHERPADRRRGASGTAQRPDERGDVRTCRAASVGTVGRLIEIIGGA